MNEFLLLISTAIATFHLSNSESKAVQEDKPLLIRFREPPGLTLGVESESTSDVYASRAQLDDSTEENQQNLPLEEIELSSIDPNYELAREKARKEEEIWLKLILSSNPFDWIPPIDNLYNVDELKNWNWIEKNLPSLVGHYRWIANRDFFIVLKLDHQDTLKGFWFNFGKVYRKDRFGPIQVDLGRGLGKVILEIFGRRFFLEKFGDGLFWIPSIGEVEKYGEMKWVAIRNGPFCDGPEKQWNEKNTNDSLEIVEYFDLEENKDLPELSILSADI